MAAIRISSTDVANAHIALEALASKCDTRGEQVRALSAKLARTNTPKGLILAAIALDARGDDAQRDRFLSKLGVSDVQEARALATFVESARPSFSKRTAANLGTTQEALRAEVLASLPQRETQEAAPEDDSPVI